MERWNYEDKKYRIDCVGLPAEKWRSKLRLIPALEKLKSQAASDKRLSSYADVVFFEFRNRQGERVKPELDEVKGMLVNRTSPVHRYDQYGQTVHRELLIRRKVKQLEFETPLCAWAFFQDYCSQESSIQATNQGIWGVFERYKDPQFMPVYKVDGYCHQNTNQVWEVEDLANPLNLVPAMFGISTNQVMLASPGCISSVHVEDGRLGSYNVLLIGRKIWFFVIDPTGNSSLAEMGGKLETALRSVLRNSGEVGAAYWKCPNFLKSKLYAFTPELQELHGLRIVTIVQEAGQVVFTSPDTFHLVLTLEATVSVAVNYMPLTYVPRLADFCSSSNPNERELHRGHLRIIYDTLLTEWGDLDKLKKYFIAELNSTGLKGCGLAGLTSYSGAINSILDKAEQLKECMNYDRYVWTNLNSGTKESVPVRVLHVTVEYAVVSYGLRQPFCRPLQSIEIYPDRFEYNVARTKKFRSPNIHIPDLHRFAVLSNRALLHHQHDEGDTEQEVETDLVVSPQETPLELDNSATSELPCQPGMPVMIPAQLPMVAKNFKFVVNGVPRSCTNGCVHKIFSGFGTIFGLTKWGRNVDQYLVIYDQSEHVERLLQLSSETSIKHAGVQLVVLPFVDRRADNRRRNKKKRKDKEDDDDEEDSLSKSKKRRNSSTTIFVKNGGVVQIYNK